jgi:hypothetical protein
MGTVARTGIAGGRKIAANALLFNKRLAAASGSDDGFPSRELLDSRSEELCAQMKAEQLPTRADVEFLLEEASLPALLYLVSKSRGTTRTPLLPRPLMVLPLQEWTESAGVQAARDRAVQGLRELPFADLDVSVDTTDLASFERTLEIVRYLSLRRPGVRFVGPSVEKIVEWISPEPLKIGRHGTKGPAAAHLKRLSAVLFAMREAGFYRLRFSTDLDYLQRFEVFDRMEEAGITSVVGTPVDLQGGTPDIATHLLRLRELSDREQQIRVWVPIVLDERRSPSEPFDPLIEMKVLRLLAAGALCLPNVLVRRVSSVYLSLAGMNIARLFGANDLGYGAVDDVTASVMHITPYHELIGAFQV